MAVSKKCGDSLKSKLGEEMNFEFVRYIRALGRKRVMISRKEARSRMDLSSQTPSMKHCGHRKAEESKNSRLEALPQDVLVRILCGVDHDDLNKLLTVSKSIKEATLIAKRSHFAYRTPKKFRVFGPRIQFEVSHEPEKMEAPNAPIRQNRTRSLGKELESITVALFMD